MPDYERMVELLVQTTSEQQKQIETLHTMVTEQSAMLSRHSAEIQVLTRALIGLGMVLTAMKALPSEAADLIVSAILDETNQDIREKARRVVEMLEVWSSRAPRQDPS
jgi:uncharacterized coiled-coil protein SlyX